MEEKGSLVLKVKVIEEEEDKLARFVMDKFLVKDLAVSKYFEIKKERREFVLDKKYI